MGMYQLQIWQRVKIFTPKISHVANAAFWLVGDPKSASSRFNISQGRYEYESTLNFRPKFEDSILGPKYGPSRLICAAFRPQMSLRNWKSTLHMVAWPLLSNSALWLADNFLAIKINNGRRKVSFHYRNWDQSRKCKIHSWHGLAARARFRSIL
jgi:hypothetical protein